MAGGDVDSREEPHAGPEHIGDATMRVLRNIWWRQRRLGNTLPAQPGVIVVHTEAHGGP